MNSALEHIHELLLRLKNEVQKDIIGQDDLIDKLIITLFAGGHALIEGVPGLGKTKTVRTLATVLALDTKRISFTPDLLPSDLTGSEIYRIGKGDFTVRKGPIFTNILLADEINRTPPKVQSALLEAMEEKKVTIGDTTFPLSEPFVVFATQNPLEHEGTYPLPEAQLDRFLMKIVLHYPNTTDEKRIFLSETKESLRDREERFEPINPTDIIEMQEYIKNTVRVDEKIYEYISSLLEATRKLTK
jgi:MoxR-like ATPase